MRGANYSQRNGPRARGFIGVLGGFESIQQYYFPTTSGTARFLTLTAHNGRVVETL